MFLCHIFLCQILLNMLQCQLVKKSGIIDCVLPEKEKLLGSAHAQQKYNASPTWTTWMFSVNFLLLLCFTPLIVDLVKFYLWQKKLLNNRYCLALFMYKVKRSFSINFANFGNPRVFAIASPVTCRG